MKLRDRFRRLSLWNKVGVVGAVASLVGLPLAIILAVVPRYCTSALESAPQAPRVRQEVEPTENGPRRDLSAKELVLQLEVQLRHLDRFLKGAESDPNMVREVATKANLLAGTEDGLLLHLMDHFNIRPKRMIGNALGREPLTLPEYLDKTAQVGRTKDGREVTLTYRQLIHLTAIEEGGADQPLTANPDFQDLRNHGLLLRIGNEQIFVRQLKGAGRTVLAYGEQLLHELRRRPDLYE